ncbi:MAG: hypothetical protein LCI00_22630 [Chloroflexi bacterium]|nr:hypothetical protein [Chloroflexota bacterium]MCC6895264.1 hypothetical protein [Anaerolineae bacterium]
MTKLPSSFDRFLDKIFEELTPEYIMAFTMSEEEQERADILLDRNNAGLLTAEEKTELESMLEIERFMTLLKAKALLALTNKQ